MRLRGGKFALPAVAELDDEVVARAGVDGDVGGEVDKLEVRQAVAPLLVDEGREDVGRGKGRGLLDVLPANPVR